MLGQTVLGQLSTFKFSFSLLANKTGEKETADWPRQLAGRRGLYGS